MRRLLNLRIVPLIMPRRGLNTSVWQGGNSHFCTNCKTRYAPGSKFADPVLLKKQSLHLASDIGYNDINFMFAFQIDTYYTA